MDMTMHGTTVDIGSMILEWYDTYHRGMYGYVYTMLGNHADAEDVVQNVFAAIAGMGEKALAIRHPKTYLFRAARNNALRAMVSCQRHCATPLDILVEEPSTPSNVHARITAATLNQALASLDPLERETVIMSVYEDMTFREVAKMTDRLLPTVATKFYRAMRKLKAQRHDMSTNPIRKQGISRLY